MKLFNFLNRSKVKEKKDVIIKEVFITPDEYNEILYNENLKLKKMVKDALDEVQYLKNIYIENDDYCIFGPLDFKVTTLRIESISSDYEAKIQVLKNKARRLQYEKKV